MKRGVKIKSASKQTKIIHGHLVKKKKKKKRLKDKGFSFMNYKILKFLKITPMRDLEILMHS